MDPRGAADRAAARRAERRVWLRPLDDGMAELGAHRPAAVATAAFDRIDRLARGDGDDRPMDAVRADMLTGHDTGADTAVRVNVTVDAATLAEHPAEFAGYGPIDPVTARELSGDATWRRLLTGIRLVSLGQQGLAG